MSSTSVMEFEVPVSVSAEAMWDAVLVRLANGGRCPFPMLVPEVYASVEGPWLHVGSVLAVKFNNGMKDCKWTHIEMDASSFTVKFRWVEEEGPMTMRSHAISIVHVPTGEASCSIRFSLQFDGKVATEYAEAMKEVFTRTAFLFSSRLISTTQPN